MTDKPVVTFRSPEDDVPFKPPAITVYELALVLAEKVDALIEQAERARFYVKDRLDQSVTAMVLQVGRAKLESGTERRRYYKLARKLAVDCATILDILQRRHNAFADQIGPAQVVAASLVEHLDVLAHT